MRHTPPLSLITAAAGLLAGLPADAAVNTRVDVLVSTDGVNFSSFAVVNLNQQARVEVLVRMTYIGTPAAAGFGSAVFQPTVSPWDASDVLVPFAHGGFGSNTSTPSGAVPNAPGQYGRISPFARLALGSSQALFGHVHSGGSGGAPAGRWLRVAQRQATGWIGGTGNTTGGAGVPVGQPNDVGRTPDIPAFNPSLSVDVFRFAVDVTLDMENYWRFVSIPLDSFGQRNTTTGEREVWWYATMDEAAPSLRGTAEVHVGNITWVPAPGVAGLLLGLGLVAVARRR